MTLLSWAEIILFVFILLSSGAVVVKRWRQGDGGVDLHHLWREYLLIGVSILEVGGVLVKGR